MSEGRDYASMSDDELIAMERDASIPTEVWTAVEAERGRRARAAGSSPRTAAAPPAAAHALVGDSAGLETAMSELNGLLVPGERLLAVAVQRRLFALSHRRTIVAATTGRFIALRRGLIGGYKPFDIRWQDLHDANITAGAFGATLTVSTLAHADLATREGAGVPHAFEGLRKLEAQHVYQLCQAQEQSWREKRRVRDLDEMRAESGGVQIGGSIGGVAAGVASNAGDPTARLRRAKEMLDGGLITDAEYESIKARVVDGL
ncbi:MAG: PH domain-containing protein [bacterium]